MIRDLVAAADGQFIAAIGTTGMLPALLLLDADGRVLRRCIRQNDARTTAACRETCKRLRTLYPWLHSGDDTRMAPAPT